MRITGKTSAVGNTKDVEIAAPLSNFQRTIEMPLINCEINLILTWLANCVITSPTGTGEFTVADIKLYALVVTLSTKDNAKLLQGFKSRFKRTINWNKYQSEKNKAVIKITFRLLN